MQTVLVTGASAGFGKAISQRLIADGYLVLGAARRMDRLLALQKELGEHFIPIKMDVSDPLSIEHAFVEIDKKLNQLNKSNHSINHSIDVLINNAGLALGMDKADQADFKNWSQMIDTNISGLVLITHKILPFMVKENKGLIINLGSIAGNYPYPGGNVYGASKAFVKQFSLNLRADLAGKKIRVTNIEPGLCSGTEFSLVRLKGDEEAALAIYKDVKAIQPENIAETVAWIIKQPEHVNINSIEMMPTAQSFSALNISRNI